MRFVKHSERCSVNETLLNNEYSYAVNFCAVQMLLERHKSQNAETTPSGKVRSEVLCNASLVLGEGRSSFDPGVPSGLDISNDRLTVTAVCTIAIRPMIRLGIAVDVVWDLLVIVRAWYLRRIRGSLGMRTPVRVS